MRKTSKAMLASSVAALAIAGIAATAVPAQAALAPSSAAAITNAAGRNHSNSQPVTTHMGMLSNYQSNWAPAAGIIQYPATRQVNTSIALWTGTANNPTVIANQDLSVVVVGHGNPTIVRTNQTSPLGLPNNALYQIPKLAPGSYKLYVYYKGSKSYSDAAFVLGLNVTAS